MKAAPKTAEKLVDSIPAELELVIDQNGYSEVRDVAGQGWCGLMQFNFTWGLVVNVTPLSYSRRYCFEHKADAALALLSWSGQGHPSGPWIKCKGAAIDLLNPELK